MTRSIPRPANLALLVLALLLALFSTACPTCPGGSECPAPADMLPVMDMECPPAPGYLGHTYAGDLTSSCIDGGKRHVEWTLNGHHLTTGLEDCSSFTIGSVVCDMGKSPLSIPVIGADSQDCFLVHGEITLLPKDDAILTLSVGLEYTYKGMKCSYSGPLNRN